MHVCIAFNDTHALRPYLVQSGYVGVAQLLQCLDLKRRSVQIVLQTNQSKPIDHHTSNYNSRQCTVKAGKMVWVEQQFSTRQEEMGSLTVSLRRVFSMILMATFSPVILCRPDLTLANPPAPMVSFTSARQQRTQQQIKHNSAVIQIQIRAYCRDSQSPWETCLRPRMPGVLWELGRART